MPIVTNAVSQQPNGVVATNAILAALSVATTIENTTVHTLGGNVVGDGNAGLYFFQAASTRPIDNVTVLGTPSTGRWIAANTSNVSSGVGPITSSLTGYAETFVLLSGFAPIVYALPPSTNVIGETITIRTQTTGTVTIRPGNAIDQIYDQSKTSPVLAVTSLTSTLTGGFVFNFRVQSGAFYRIDTPWGAI